VLTAIATAPSDVRTIPPTMAPELRRRVPASGAAHGGAVATIRGEKWRERRRLEREWEQAHGPGDAEVYWREILPTVRMLPTRELVQAIGLTRAYCARILKGELVPHARHWARIAALGREAAVDPTHG